ncbi:PadR family transcriptional regulator [Enterococcus sp. MJM12]|uniref:PadR family transcriptional regulator n=1 Tax=Candidatus Enterococcus myersii TaxID=2815322 RepID=A0ABS3H3F6_9ENTE|nr:PadR family transcriptional regulator [Enterococcus sp. MJM12]MBO0447985.1 PadR family transcriptional regulator [Enterococcus sp. MJM12]
MEIDKEVLRGYIDPIILTILNEEDSYGYDIAKKAKKISQEAFELKEGTLYVAFKRLEKNGYVTSYWQSGTGVKRKYYHITTKGNAFLRHKKQEWLFIEKLMNTFYKGVN